jgi:SRSO17 transposase
LEDYADMLKTGTRDTSNLAEVYISGIPDTERGKGNIERILEEIEVGGGDGYQQIQQSVSDSTWDPFALMTSVACHISDFYARQTGYDIRDVGYIIDESAHLKKGKQSVGVARQYAGVIGKVDNCQVGVYASLVNQTRTGLSNARLYLPECWTEDDAKCEKAGIPITARTHKTKPQLALEMLRADIDAGIRFGWVGGDGLYGHGYELSHAIDDLGLTFLSDVHCDQTVYLTEPEIAVPEKKPGRGRTPTLPRAEALPINVGTYQERLGEAAWQEVKVRDTAKGFPEADIHVREVWVWDGKEHRARRRVLVIIRNKTNKKLRYSLSNAELPATSSERLAYMQAQRYWVERSFQDAKSEIGMSDYQVRKWQGWHHHMALIILAMSFLLQERIRHQDDYPLLSCRDVRILIIALLTNDRNLTEKRFRQMTERHKQRYKDIQRYFKT